MSTFADVEQFARQHAACGGLTPNAQSRPGAGGGYLLTITCACGAQHDRWVTAEEASQPLPRPPRQPAPTRASVSAPTPVVTWPTRPPPLRPARIAVTAQPAPRGSRGRVVWLLMVLLVALGAGAGVYLAGGPVELDGVVDQLAGLLDEGSGAAPAGTTAPPDPPAVFPHVRERATLDEIVTSLRQLQASTAPGVSLNDYASHVASTRVIVERLVTEAPVPARAPAREVLDVYRLAGAAWRARTLDDREEWERVGRDPAIGLCLGIKAAADAAGAPGTAARARGVAVGAALQPLWECAAEKIAALGRIPAG